MRLFSLENVKIALELGPLPVLAGINSGEVVEENTIIIGHWPTERRFVISDSEEKRICCR
jgi:hypothetical protein